MIAGVSEALAGGVHDAVVAVEDARVTLDNFVPLYTGGLPRRECREGTCHFHEGTRCVVVVTA